jgi:EmrB/QacA subfamily drug resistance transporter
MYLADMTRLQSLRSNPWVTLLVLCLGLFMNLLDTTIVYVATPSMLTDLHASFDAVLWVFNGYLLSFSILLIPAGRLGDLFGPKRLTLVGLALFTAASAACGLSTDASQLIAARVVQGVGGALLMPQMLPFIAALFSADRRGSAFGVNGAVVGLSTVAGPVLGGFIVTNADWRWIFYLNVPVGIIAFAAVLLLVPDLRPGRSHSFDPVGIVLASASLFAIVFGLIEGQRYSWSTITGALTVPEVIAAGVVLLALFVVWESRQREPLVPLRLFRLGDFAINNWIGVAIAFGMQAAFIPLTIYTQSVLGMSALTSGLTFAPMSVAAGVVAPFAGRFTDRIGGRPILVAGLGLFAAGISWTAALAAVGSNSWTFFVPMVVTGIGMGGVFAPSITVAMRPIRTADAGSASGVLNTTRQVGSAMGAAVMGAVLQNRLASLLPSDAAQAAQQLPIAARAAFTNGFASAAKGNLEVGVGQAGHLALPAGIPAQLAAQIQALATQVFDNAYIAAMRPTVALGMAVVLAGAASALLLERGWRRSRVPEVEAQPAEAA